MADVEQIVGGGMLVGGGGALAIAALKFGEAMMARLPSWTARERAKAGATERAAEAAADLIQLALQASGTSVSQLIARLDAAEAKISQLETENAQCHAQNAQLTQKYESLESWLHKNGVVVPVNQRPGLIVLTGASAEMTTAPTPDQRKPGT